MTDPKFIKNFKKIIKKIPDDAEIFAGRGRECVNLQETNLNELYEKVTKWSDQSFKGLLCGIFGCPENPKNKCPICGGHYCYDHIKIHFHAKDNAGIILSDIQEI